MNEDKELVLSEQEAKILEKIADIVEPGKSYDLDYLAERIGVDRSTLEAIIRLLKAKGLVEIMEIEKRVYRPTREALYYLEHGFPEERLVEILSKNNGVLDVEEAKKLLGDEFEKAIVNAARKQWVQVREGKILLKTEATRNDDREALEAIVRGETGSVNRKAIAALKRRKLVEERRVKKTQVKFIYSPREVLERALIAIGALTHEHLVSGRWRSLVFREYDVTAEPPRVKPSRLHFFREFIEHLRDIMKEMGFVEVSSGVVELELWNYDVLFQPQHHPARSPTDTFYLENPSKGNPDKALVERVANIHKTRLAYDWREELAERLVLRSHTTPTSVRTLYQLKPRPPFRYFTIGKVYRVETIDSKHLLEFHQLDGIASEEGISFAALLGLLSEFFERIGIREYRFRPAYFPFTEPSAEASVKIGNEWIEVLGCGMFRPEVLEAIGVDYPVAAWGMGLERIAMAVYGVSDIRHLYSFDVDYLRSIPIRWWIYAGLGV